MANFPDELYILSQRDLQLAYLTPLIRSVSDATVGASNGVAITVDRSTCAVVQKVVFGGTPSGVATAVVRTNLFLLPPVPAPMGSGVLVWAKPVQVPMGGTGAFFNEVDFSGGLYIPEGWRISCGVDYDASAANVTSLSVFGMSVPMGNIERV